MTNHDKLADDSLIELRTPFIAIAFVIAAALHQFNALLKGLLVGLGIQLDLIIITEGLIALTGLLFATSRAARGLGNSSLAPLFAFTAWATASLLWSVGFNIEISTSIVRVFGQIISFPIFKWADFLVGCVIPFIVASMFSQRYPQIVRIHIFIFCGFILLILPYAYVFSDGMIIDEQGIEIGIISNVSYISFGLYFSSLLVATLVIAIRYVPRPEILGAAAVIASLATYIILVSGSTQALLAPFVILPIMMGVELWRNWRSANHVGLVALSTAIAIGATLISAISLASDVLNQYDSITGISRLISKLDEDVGFLNSSGRSELREVAVDEFLSSPVYGVGIGGYSGNSYESVKDYPHQIFYEILCELGLVGLILFCWFLWTIFVSVRDVLVEKTVVGDIVTYLAILYGISALSSGELNDHRILFLFLGYLVGMANAIRRLRSELPPLDRA